MLPTFLGIGVPRGGTTWLHQLLCAHPDVAMPTRRKEVHYFDTGYERGEAWYQSFFPPDRDRHKYRAVGEITPHYLFFPEAPGRIRRVPSINRLIVILRDPVARSFSHYLWRRRMDNFQGSFERFLESFPKATRYSRYSEGLLHYRERFGEEEMLILIHEELFDDVRATRGAIADFIGVGAERFPVNAGVERVNAAATPRFATVYSVIARASHHLRKHDLDWLPNTLGRTFGLKYMFSRQRGDRPALTDEMRGRALHRFLDDIERVEEILGRGLESWKSPCAVRRQASGGEAPAR